MEGFFGGKFKDWLSQGRVAGIWVLVWTSGLQGGKKRNVIGTKCTLKCTQLLLNLFNQKSECETNKNYVFWKMWFLPKLILLHSFTFACCNCLESIPAFWWDYYQRGFTVNGVLLKEFWKFLFHKYLDVNQHIAFKKFDWIVFSVSRCCSV